MPKKKKSVKPIVETPLHILNAAAKRSKAPADDNVSQVIIDKMQERIDVLEEENDELQDDVNDLTKELQVKAAHIADHEKPTKKKGK